jgi:CPA2 family monovalent cation:H+ antiporter-2
MHLPLLQDLVILLAFSLGIVFVLNKAKIPSILGFLLTGVIIGPHALSLINAVEEVEVIAEIGVILLLFVIGLELSIKQLISIKKTVFLGGSIQVGVTILIASLIYYFLGNSFNESLFIGFLFSLSSTAIVLKVFQERNELGTPYGKNALALLIFQDLIVVPMMLLTPILAGVSEDVTSSVLSLLVKTIIVIVITIISARYLVPKLMHAIAKTGSKELFLFATFTICFAVAFLTSEAGLSLALGAFLAGLIISESEYSHQATSTILPFGELFTSLFFISVGMLLDLTFFIQNIGIITLLVLVVFIVKSLVTAFAVAVLKYPTRTIIITGVSLFQVGEFSFILSKVGIQYNIISVETNQLFLAVSIVTMLLTPFVILISEKIAFGVLKIKFLNRFFTPEPEEVINPLNDIENHLIIIGCGLNGTNLVKAATHINIPFLLVEQDEKIVTESFNYDVPTIYGDATDHKVLDALNLNKARALVIAIADIEQTRTVLKNVRKASQSLHIIVRTRDVDEIEELHALGADEIIPEEFETSIQIFNRVMSNFLIPLREQDAIIKSLRTKDYRFFQPDGNISEPLAIPEVPDFNISSLKVTCDSGKILKKSISELDIRKTFGVNVLSIKRGEDTINVVGPHEIIKRGDVLFVQGKQDHIEAFSKLL